MTSLETIADVLDARLAPTPGERRDEAHGVWRPAARRVRQIGLALDPDAVPAAWLQDGALDALLLHRPWGIDERSLPAGLGVLAYHRAFDACLTTGYNPALARALELHAVEPFGQKDDRPLGMVGTCTAEQSPAGALRAVVDVFGGLEAAHPPTRRVERIAAVRAMNSEHVEAAHARGADLYLTGQMRAPGHAAVARTGIGVAAVGHRRSERWGLGVLAGLLRQRFSTLRVRVAEAA